jgi:nucleotide-binding universal stress UspA family protein
VSLTSIVEKQLGRNFVIFHPSDFSAASEVAFGHALKIAMQSKAKLDVMHVDTQLSSDQSHWRDFPAVRATLSRWGIFPEAAGRDEIANAGLRIRKILKSGADPVETMLRHFRRLPPDLIVLASHQREGIERWLHKAVAEPVARRSGAMTLFVPQDGRGFVSISNGTVSLHKILIPFDHNPHAQPALSKASLLARGLDCAVGEIRLLHVGQRAAVPLIDMPHWPGWSYDTIVKKAM